MQRRRFVAAVAAGLVAAFAAAPATAKPQRKAAAKGSGRKAKRKDKPVAAADRQPARSEPIAEPAEPAITWRSYELQTTVSLPATRGPLRVWLPLAAETPWQRVREHLWSGNADQVGTYVDADSGAGVLFAEWTEARVAPQLRLTTGVATRDRQFDITRRNAVAEAPEVLRAALRGSARLPTDGLVRTNAERIIGRIKDPVAQGKALYDWIVERNRFDPQGSDCGSGDILAMLERPEIPGRSLDINGLFVALARSIGMPARLAFGVRVDRSLIVSSLGLQGELSGAGHCRAEFHATGYGWIPVDPADVRKALAEDTGVLDGMKATVLRKLLFGFWEGNWVAYHRGQDIALRRAEGSPLASFTGPYVEIAGRPATPDDAVKIATSARRRPDLGT